MILSIIIPIFNEERFIEETIKQVASFQMPGIEKEIIAIDDGSSDQTSKILSRLGKHYPFVLVTHRSNYGKGVACISGLKNSTGDIIIIQDADLEYSPRDYPKLIKALDDETDAVYGYRSYQVIGSGRFFYWLGAKILTLTINFLFLARLTDSYTGYKLFKRKVISQIDLKSRGFEFEAEITCRLLKNARKIKEIPISYYPRKKSQGKHIKFRDTLKGLKTIIKERCSS